MNLSRLLTTIAVLALLSLQSCSTQQPPPGGYSKAEQAAIRQEARDRRAAFRTAGLDILNFGLNSAAGAINRDEGFRK